MIRYQPGVERSDTPGYHHPIRPHPGRGASTRSYLMAFLFALMLTLPVPTTQTDDSDHAEQKKRYEHVLAILASPDSVELYSLKPLSHVGSREEIAEWQKKGDMFHFEGVMGKVEIKDPRERQALLDAFREAKAAFPKGSSGDGCFVPHHGMRLRKGSQVADILICFTCGHAYYHLDEKKAGSSGVAKDYEYARPFDVILTKHGIKLAD